VKKKKPWQAVLIVLGALALAQIVQFLYVILLTFGGLFAWLQCGEWKCQWETYSQFRERRSELEQTITHYRKFPCAENPFFTGSTTYGFFYSPDDTYDDFFGGEPERKGRGYETRSSNTGVDYRDYAEKICDNWYYYEESYNY
jgi:hypothetical protein